jgi:predicted nucleotidyltransferase component of viral defense system
MFSDDELLETLVLKGGNAMALVHRLSARASVDLDFSMSHDFPDGIERIQERIEKVLTETFRENGFEVFDLKMIEKPKEISEEMADFWGGYGVEFKLITLDLHKQHAHDLSALRRHALSIGQGQKFLIDISRFEYTQGKQKADFDGYRIYVYSPEMIVCEKLRAICQQMPAYGPIIKRGRAGSARARDFIDIYILVDALKIDVLSEKVQQILTDMFAIKRVPLAFLGKVCEFRDFHREDFPAVRATMATGVKVQEFDFYFDYALDLIDSLKPLWNKEAPILDEGRFPHPVG